MREGGIPASECDLSPSSSAQMTKLFPAQAGSAVVAACGGSAAVRAHHVALVCPVHALPGQPPVSVLLQSQVCRARTPDPIVRIQTGLSGSGGRPSACSVVCVSADCRPWSPQAEPAQPRTQCGVRTRRWETVSTVSCSAGPISSLTMTSCPALTGTLRDSLDDPEPPPHPRALCVVLSAEPLALAEVAQTRHLGSILLPRTLSVAKSAHLPGVLSPVVRLP